jgi:5-hydroxyisourate hydrolase-like protein (transthyretin family)
MIQQTGVALSFGAFYIDNATGTGKTGLTVTVDIYRDSTKIITGAAATAAGDGLYRYVLIATQTATAGRYTAIFKTTDTTVRQRDIADVFFLGFTWTQRLDLALTAVNMQATLAAAAAGNADAQATYIITDLLTPTWLARLDAAVSTRLAASAYTAPPGAAAIADAVWDEPIAGHTAAGSTGAALSIAQAAGDPLASPVPGAYPPGTAGAQIARIGSAQIGVSSPVTVTGRVTLHQGKDYHAADGTALAWTIASPIDLTGSAVTFDFAGVQCAGVVSGSAGEWVVRVNLAAAALALVPTGVYPYELVAVLTNGRTAPPLAVGTVEVRAEV